MMQQLQDGLGKAHGELAGEFSKLKSFGKMVEQLTRRFDQLAELGANVTTEDVVKAATGLVGGGFGAKDVATLLADMPPEGQALAEWVAQRAMESAEASAKFQQAFESTRHQLGTAGLGVLASHSAGDQPQSQVNALGSAPVQTPMTGEASAAPNQLTGGESNA